MKWIKRLLLLVAILLVGAIMFSAGSWYLLRRTPVWYAQAMPPEERAAAANRADQKVLGALSWAADAEAYAIQERNAAKQNTTLPTTTPLGAHTVSFTQAELNAFFAKWAETHDWDKRYGHYLTEPLITLHNGRLVLAGRFQELDTVVSLHFRPKLTPDGKLDLELSRVMGGRLPLPQAMWSKQVKRVENKLRAMLPQLQRDARIKANGATNNSAVGAAAIKLLLQTLNSQPGDPVLFLPIVDGQTDELRSVPVKLTHVSVDNETLTLTAEPMSADERKDLLQRIRQPQDSLATTDP